MERIKAVIGEDWTLFQDGIRHYLRSEIELLNTVNDSLLSNKGKQVRPLMALLIARALNGSATPDSIRYAVSAELLHNATLFHDDVADKSDKRRGRPTLRALMGPESSVLIGDFWLVCALRAIMDSTVGRDRCLQIFSRTLGDLAEGEMLQLQKASSCDTTFEDYLKIIYGKTASLFVSSTVSAAISVGAPEAMIAAAEDYGRYIGYAFQIKDDILDYAGNDEVGKPLGVDILEQKITLPLLGALDNAGDDKARQVRSAIKDDAAAARDGVISFVRENGGVEYAAGVLEEYVGKAVEALDAFPPSEEKECLKKLASFVALRKK